MEENKQELPEISEEQKKDLLKLLLRKTLEEKKSSSSSNEDKIELLKKLKNLYDKKNVFEVGDIIRWKPQLKNRKLPDYNEPTIVLEVLAEPVLDDSKEVGNAYYREKNDIRVGVLRDDTLLMFYFDSNRFESFK